MSFFSGSLEQATNNRNIKQIENEHSESDPKDGVSAPASQAGHGSIGSPTLSSASPCPAIPLAGLLGDHRYDRSINVGGTLFGRVPHIYYDRGSSSRGRGGRSAGRGRCGRGRSGFGPGKSSSSCDSSNVIGTPVCPAVESAFIEGSKAKG